MEVIEAMRQEIYELIAKMNLPGRLRDVGVQESDLPRLAEIAFQNRTIQNNPKPITDMLQLKQLLQEAW